MVHSAAIWGFDCTMCTYFILFYVSFLSVLFLLYLYVAFGRNNTNNNSLIIAFNPNSKKIIYLLGPWVRRAFPAVSL